MASTPSLLCFSAFIVSLLLAPGAFGQSQLTSAGFMIDDEPHEFCQPGAEGDAVCAGIGSGAARPCCAPLAYLPWRPQDKAAAMQAYTPLGTNFSSVGACFYCDPTSVAFNHTADFTYSPDPRYWAKSAQPTFNALTTVNTEGDPNNGLSQTVSYSKSTGSTFTFTANQELDLGASFKFTVGGCALCPASAETTFSVMLKAGFAESHTSTETDQWSTSDTIVAKPGTCSASIMNVKQVNNLAVGWVASVNTTCSKTAIYKFILNPSSNYPGNFTVPCGDVEKSVNAAGANAKVLSTTPPQFPTGPDGAPIFTLYQPFFGGTAIYEVTGTMTVSFGVSVGSAICSCSNSTCLNTNLGFDFQTNTPAPTPPTLPANDAVVAKLSATGVNIAGLGAVQPINGSLQSCATCSKVQPASNNYQVPVNEAPATLGAVQALQVTPQGAGAGKTNGIAAAPAAGSSVASTNNAAAAPSAGTAG